jgi:uncharacterized SAM-binding protein YcdF (DUF218 family)
MINENQILRFVNLNKYFSLALIIISITFGFTIFGLLRFIDLIPERSENNNPNSDAIIVLTGGSNRLKEGLQLLTAKNAKKLFISGVYRGNDVRRLLKVQKYNPTEVVCCINLGYTATSTTGNAIESAVWIRENNFKSIILVTSNYHMPRSLMLFKQIMPTIKINAHPVFPEKFEPKKWWAQPRTASLIVSEYIKYTIASVEWSIRLLWINTNNSMVTE